jgi:hypothetical protein
MILLSQHGWTASGIADLLGYDPSSVRRWIHRYHTHGTAGLADRPRSGRPPTGQPHAHQADPAAARPAQSLDHRPAVACCGPPAISLRILHRRVRQVASWRRPRLVAKSDPDRDQILADLHHAIAKLPDLL